MRDEIQEKMNYVKMNDLNTEKVSGEKFSIFAVIWEQKENGNILHRTETLFATTERAQKEVISLLEDIDLNDLLSEKETLKIEKRLVF